MEEGKAEFDFSPSDSVCGSGKDQEGEEGEKKKSLQKPVRGHTQISGFRRQSHSFSAGHREGGGGESRSPFLRGEREDGGKDRTDELRNRRFTAPEERPTSLSHHKLHSTSS